MVNIFVGSDGSDRPYEEVIYDFLHPNTQVWRRGVNFWMSPADDRLYQVHEEVQMGVSM